jgi:hypothetical protein
LKINLIKAVLKVLSLEKGLEKTFYVVNSFVCDFIFNPFIPQQKILLFCLNPNGRVSKTEQLLGLRKFRKIKAGGNPYRFVHEKTRSIFE